ncbi:MAG: sigma-70 family RNA polymerase sigma factor [Sphingobacteriales bacterium]|nr:sigma-70 family RNA polymerase sigma factor [Sphingobacteriales bacterium]
MGSGTDINKTIEHLFRHESGKLIASLTKVFGTHNLELAEDVVQDTLLQAMHSWKMKTIPDNPTAWLFTVAKNKAIDIIRKGKRYKELATDISYLLKSEYTLSSTINELVSSNDITDDQLRMMFTCCHPTLTPESQVALILKTLCGFNVAEIAKTFICSDDTIEKRLYRAKQQFRERRIEYEIPSGTELEKRLDNVLTAVYLLFNEGYNSANHASVIRTDVQEEAMRLCELLIQNPHTKKPAVFALLALMYVTSARNDARIDHAGNILLLKQQNRNLWNAEKIQKGLRYMELSAEGDVLTTYHLEALIACEYVLTNQYSTINWQAILGYYNLLYQQKPSAVVALNRAVVVAEIYGAKAGIKAIMEIGSITSLQNYYLLPAILGDLYLKAGNRILANEYFSKAIELTLNEAEKKFLKEKIK